MNKNTIIKIIVIVAAFGASALVLYNGFFKGKGGANVPQAPIAGFAAITIEEILPNGGSLDFDKVINISRFKFGLMKFPILDPKNEVGKSPDNLITPMESQ